jgi:tetratricopeptide (TPR) repeat protein
MAINPYDSCPCGSGKKFKWCCTAYFDQIERALQQQQQQQHDGALRTMDALIQKHGDRPQVWGYYANILFAEGKTDAAEQAIDKALALQADFGMAYLLRGLFRQAEGEAIGAHILFRKASEAYPADAQDQLAQVYELIARGELMLNRPVACRAALEQAVKNAQYDQELKGQFDAMFGAESRLPEPARKAYAFRPTVRMLPDGALTGKLSDARKAYETLTQQTADDPAAWFNLGLVHAWLGEPPQAVAALKKSVELEVDDYRAEEAAALVEVLLCATGMEADADEVEHRCDMQIRDPQVLAALVQQWSQTGKLMAAQMDPSGQFFTALVVKELPSILETGTKLATVLAELELAGGMIRLSHLNEENVKAIASEVRDAVHLAVSEPQFSIGHANFGDIPLAALAYPIQSGSVEETETKMRDHVANYLETTWLHAPVRSFGGASPLDAVGSSLMRKRVIGKLKFLEGCYTSAAPRKQKNGKVEPLDVYDFNKLRHKLGIEMTSVAAPASQPAIVVKPAAAPAKRDFAAMNAAELATLPIAELSVGELEDALKSAIKLDARELAVSFAKTGVAKPVDAAKPDRYPFYACLMTAALAEGKFDDVLKVADDGIQYDLANNDGKQVNTFHLRKAAILSKRGDVDGAAKAFNAALERSPKDGNLYVKAAEAMLGAKNGKFATEFAERGLAVGNDSGNRDLQGVCKELLDAAKRYV